MLDRFLVAAALLAFGVTDASALNLPAAPALSTGKAVMQVAEAGKGAQVVRRAPAAVKHRPVISQRPLVVKRAPVQAFKKSAPVVVRKSPPPLAMKKIAPITKFKPVAKMPAKFVHIRPHRRHKWHGRAIGGVILGSLLAASVYYAYSEPPEEGLCWYWTSSSRERGYWDYCEPPQDEDD